MLRYYFALAIRGMRRTPWLALLMILSLAVGIAAGMTTITLRYVLALDPIPAKSERLLNLHVVSGPAPLRSRFSYAHARALARLAGRHGNAVISGEGIVRSLAVNERQQSFSRGVGIRYATPSFFSVFDVPLEKGRVWTRAEAQSAAPVVVMDAETANNVFHGEPAVGKNLRIGATLYTVIGLTGHWNPRPRYYDLTGGAGAFGGGGDALFMPITAISHATDDTVVSLACASKTGAFMSPVSELLSSSCAWLSVWYLTHSERDTPALAQTLKSQLPQLLSDRPPSKLGLMNVRQLLTAADIVPGSVNLYALLGGGFLILCIINAAGMQLSRVLRGASQIGIRRALGASRSEIIKQYLCDALLVSGLGGLLGVSLTFAGLYGVRHLPGVYYADLARMDIAMFILMIALVLVSGVLIGVIPAWLASRADPAVVIKAAQ